MIEKGGPEPMGRPIIYLVLYLPIVPILPWRKSGILTKMKDGGFENRLELYAFC